MTGRFAIDLAYALCRTTSGNKHKHRKATQQTYEDTMFMFDAVVEDAGDTARDFELSVEEFELEEEPEFEFEI